jgi:hypothetical protein
MEDEPFMDARKLKMGDQVWSSAVIHFQGREMRISGPETPAVVFSVRQRYGHTAAGIV